MSLHHSPRIVTNGLVLHLDAANQKSYTTSASTSWNSLVVQPNSASIVNGASYSSSNSGNIVFDTTNYVDFYAPNLTASTTTVEMWAKLSNYNGKMLFGWNAYDIYCPGNALGYNTANSDLYGISSTQFSTFNPTSSWIHYVFEMKADVSYTSNKIYLNTQEQTLSQILASESSTNRNFNNGNGRISGWRNNTNYWIGMNCAIFKVYNRSLTLAEIKQNFNALRGRFGI